MRADGKRPTHGWSRARVLLILRALPHRATQTAPASCLLHFPLVYASFPPRFPTCFWAGNSASILLRAVLGVYMGPEIEGKPLRGQLRSTPTPGPAQGSGVKCSALSVLSCLKPVPPYVPNIICAWCCGHGGLLVMTRNVPAILITSYSPIPATSGVNKCSRICSRECHT